MQIVGFPMWRLIYFGIFHIYFGIRDIGGGGDYFGIFANIIMGYLDIRVF